MSNESSSSSNDKEEENQNTTSSSSVSTSSTSSSSTSSWFEPLLSLKQQWEEFDDGQRINRLKACQILDEILYNCQQKQIAQQQQNPSQQQQQSSQQQQNDDDVDDPIESVSIGLRNMKYFGWRGILSSKKAVTDTDEITKIQDENGNSNASNNSNEIKNNDEHEKNQLLFHSKIRQSCSREQHAVWACRSVSTGCGKDLSLLKRCFEDIDTDTEIEKLPPHYRILTAPYTNYEGIVERTEEEAQAQSLATMTTTTTTSSVDNNAKSSTSSSLSSSLSSLKQRIPCYDIQRQLGSCVTINGKQLLERKQKREENNK